MRRLYALLLAFPLSLAAGCGSGDGVGAAASAMTTGPHSATAFVLSNGKGYAKVLVEKENAGKKSRVKPRIVVYFLSAPDAKTPLTPAPTGVKVSLQLPDGSAASAELKADPKAGDPAGAGRFVSEPGDYDIDELRGEVSATVDGQSATATFALR